MNIFKKIGIFVLGAILASAGTVFAQSIPSQSPFWVSGSYITPTPLDTSLGLKIPSLASQNCLGTDSTGVFEAGTCSGGGSSTFGTTSISALLPLIWNTSTAQLSTLFSTSTTWGLGNNGLVMTGATGIPFSQATSTTINFGSIFANASSTIGDSTQAGGLTINGGATTTGNAVVGNLIDQGLTSGRVPYSTTGSQLTDTSGFTFDGTTLTSPLLTIAGSGSLPSVSITGNSANTSGNYFNTNIGGNQTVADTSTYYGLNANPAFNDATPLDTLTGLVGVDGNPTNSGAGIVTTMYGLRSVPQNTGTGTTTTMYGVYSAPQNTSSGTTTNMYGISSIPQETGAGIVTNEYGISVGGGVTNAAGSLTNYYGAYLSTPNKTGTITNEYGLYQLDSTAKNYFAGNVGMGTNAPASKLQITGNQSAASWTTGGLNFQVSSNTLTDNSSNGTTIATRTSNAFGQPTFAFTISTSTITNAFNLYIAGAPKSDSASSSEIINSSALYIANGSVSSGSMVGNSYGLYVNAQTGATSTNEAAVFMGGNVGISTTTPGSLLSVGATNGINFSTGTSTFSSTGGINLAAGCYAINGTCLSSSGGSSFAYPFTSPLFGSTQANATSTLMGFTGGLYALASSTIGNGAVTGGLTVSGTASTTNLIVTSAESSGCAQFSAQGLISSTGTACGSGGGSSFGNPFNFVQSTPNYLIGTSSPLGLIMTASSTIGNGAQAGGLTISGGATTTGSMSINNINIFTSNTTSQFDVSGGTPAITTGATDLASGYQTLYTNTTGSNNVALGYQADYYNDSATNTVAIGANAMAGSALYQEQGGTVVGANAGSSFKTGSDYNTLLGYDAGYNITTGSDNILIGANSNSNNSNITTGSNNISIGYNIQMPSATLSNQLNIQNIIFGTGNSGTGSTLSTGFIGIGTTTPDHLLTVTNNGTKGQLKLEDSAAAANQHYWTEQSSRGVFTINSATDANATTTALLINQPQTGFFNLFSVASTSPAKSLFAIDSYGHLSASSTAPVLSACGTGSPSLSTDSNDTYGTITAGTVATTCTLTFGTARQTGTHCAVTSQTASIAISYTESLSALVITNSALGGDKVDYVCMGQ